MSPKLAEYEKELEESKRKLEAVNAKLRELEQEAGELTSVVRGWEAIVARERKDSGQAYFPEVPVPPKSEIPEDRSIPPGAADRFHDVDEEEGGNKTQFVRDHIQNNSAYGVTANDLKRAAAAIGMVHPPSWPYGPIQRLKKKGEIVKRRGKFYPAVVTTPRALSLVG